AERMSEMGASGLFPCGTTGEGLLCSADERKTILDETIQGAGKKVRVIAHTGAMDTATTIELTQHAQAIGAYGAAVIAPCFYGYDDAALEQYYGAVAKSVPGFPVLLYNLPSCAKIALSAELVHKLATTHEN